MQHQERHHPELFNPAASTATALITSLYAEMFLIRPCPRDHSLARAADAAKAVAIGAAGWGLFETESGSFMAQGGMALCRLTNLRYMAA